MSLSLRLPKAIMVSSTVTSVGGPEMQAPYVLYENRYRYY